MNTNANNPIVEIDESLDLAQNQVFATKKLAKANAILAKTGMPKQYKPTEETLTPLQVELLHFYKHSPSEAQMKQLKDFLEKLLSNNLENSVA